ncbi:E3 ubiquitin-protein ligase AIRP2 [Linum grandiflorum]
MVVSSNTEIVSGKIRRSNAAAAAMVKSSFKDSLKALEADIQHANTLALDYPRENDGARIQMRLSYSPAAQFFMFLVQWTDCHLAGAFGLLRILIYMTYDDGKTTMSVYERRASLKEFYGVIFPSLLQLQRGITELEDRKQIEVCCSKYTRDELHERRGEMSRIDAEREEECGICMEMNPKFVLPDCNHSMCLKCFRDWRGRSELCPFCRDSLKRTNSGDLWIYTDSSEIVDLPFISRENCRRLFMYIDKLPLIVPDHLYSM